MKTKYVIAIGALASTLGFVPPCIAESYVPPQGPAQPQIMPVPTSAVWDGSEYVGQVSGKYYYLGPNNTWLPMDNTRQQRFDEWQKAQAVPGNTGEQSIQGGTTRSQGQYSSGNNPNGQPNQTENTPSGGTAKGQNAMVQSGQNGNTANQGQQPNQTTRSGGTAKGENAMVQTGQTGNIVNQGQTANGQSSQIRNTRHQGHDLGQTRTTPPFP